ncbi:MAG: calcium/sodium antiporter [Azoarcus sp.]|jgi:cation:H+ antiporter|nr:calcium/sodium antiporter [Azoarcus sp.]
MLNNALFFTLGLAALIAGAELLVRGASKLAAAFGISPLVVGLTVVAFATSAPELAVSVGAALGDASDIALGNVIGSNIANVLLILGLSALIIPLAVHSQIIRQEVPIMIGASLLLLTFALDGSLGRFEGLVLFAALVAYTLFLVRQSRAATQAEQAELTSDIPDAPWADGRPVQIALIVGGLALLALGAHWLVDAAVNVARSLGVSDLTIGLTVVAIGTSLPELATSAVAALRGERDIAVGNIIGSNIFNICAVLGITGLIAPNGIPVSDIARTADLWIMVAAVLVCLPVILTGREISRGEGGLFLAYYVAYTVWLILTARQSAQAPAFANLILGYALPATIIFLAVDTVRHGEKGKPSPPEKSSQPESSPSHDENG